MRNLKPRNFILKKKKRRQIVSNYIEFLIQKIVFTDVMTGGKEARRGHRLIWTRSYTWLWATVWVLGVGPRYLEEQLVF